MSSILNAGSLSIRRNTHMRSLFIEYPDVGEGTGILADLFNLQKVDMNINLPVIASGNNGIEVKLPTWLTGIFYLKIQDGNKSFCQRISVQ